MQTIKAYSYIRFSTPDQRKGNSLNRQLETSRNYAKENNLDLDESMQDLGISAFRGKHKTKGYLGGFLQLVEDGKVASGSVLIVENLDRLSREQPLIAISQFISIVQAGIKLVTLQPVQEYSKDNLNEGQLFLMVGEFIRANKESERKSYLISSTWETKRKEAINGNRKLTGRCPAWLTLLEDKKTFKLIPERVEVIRLIYEMKLAGKGSERIVRELNKMENIWKPQSSRKKLLRPPNWRESYIDKLLHNNRALIGEYQPCKKVNDKRIPIGDPIQLYYPSIIDVELFNRVQTQIQKNREINGFNGGRNDQVNNLFGNMAVCKSCGFPMAYVNKGKPPKGGQYLLCDSSRNGLGCHQKSIHYETVETNVLTFCKELIVADVLPNNEKSATEKSIIQNQLQALVYEIQMRDKKMDNTLKNSTASTNTAFVKALENMYATQKLERDKLSQKQTELQIRYQALEGNGKQTEKHLKDIRELIEQMKLLNGEERLELRLNLRGLLRRLISKIYVDSNNNFFLLIFQSGERRGIKRGEDGTWGIGMRAFPPEIFNGTMPK